jgi:hypothetical protein
MIRTAQMSRAIAVLLALSTIAIAGALALPVGAQAAEPPFEIQGFTASVTEELGNQFTQAGGHPYQAETSFRFPRHPPTGVYQGTGPVEQPRQVIVELPPGFIGNPRAVPECTLSNLNGGGFGGFVSGCPAASRVGTLALNEGGEGTLPVFSLVPERGYAAEFGADVLGKDVVFYGSLRSGSDYGLTITSSVDGGVNFWGFGLTFFGTPAAQNGSGAPSVPFLTNPTNCASTEVTRIHVDTWQHPGVWYEATKSSPNATGCESLPFSPSIAVTPESSVAGAPSGYDVDLHVPQNENAGGVAEAQLKKAVVALPAGVSVSPSAAAGLGACTPAEVSLHSSEAANCPESSKIGTVEIDTPLLDHPVEGGIYLASQGENPFGSLLALYIAAFDPETGVVVKLAGQVSANPVTGQLTATFDNNPQLPFEDLKLDFHGGPRAALVNPQACGTYTTTTELIPYSETAPATPSSSFQINEGCASPQQFAPAFTAGTISPQAGEFSPFTMTLSRDEAEQAFGAVSVKTPPGLLGVLTGVAQCPEPQAAQGTCGAESLIGHTTVSAGPGISPFNLGGQVFLTGPYKGAPFGLSIVVPAIAGPFNLGTVVVRASIAIDPRTAQLTVTSDPLPQILQGIPLDLRRVNVTIDRAGFTFNPTNCAPLTVGGVAQSAQNTNVAVSSPFEAASCAGLPFKPQFTASTQGNGTVKNNGASLTVKISAKQGPGVKAGEREANIKKVDVSLPYALSTRLTTLHEACTETQFAANPANCPTESDVGSATVRTPVLPVALTGPALLVSHGGAAFPDLVLVLQGDGVQIILTGNTQIKNGITSSKFEAAPDAPISAFELMLPEKKFSLLGAIENLCKPTRAKTVDKEVTKRVHGRTVTVSKKVTEQVADPLVMPTSITAQNGAVLTQSTKIVATGCNAASAKQATAKQAARKRKR